MYRVTTPTHTFTLPIETSECSAIQVTYKQNCKSLIKLYSDGVLSDGMTINGKDVIINLTQQETKTFKAGPVDVQLRALTTGDKAYASQHFTVSVLEVNNEDILL